MAVKLSFAAATLAFAALASGAFLSSVPTYKVDPDDILTSLTALSSGSIKDDELRKMEKDIEDLVTKGDDPATKLAVKQLSSFVNTVLISSRLKAEKRDQTRLDAATQAMENCGVEKQKKLNLENSDKLEQADDLAGAFKKSRAKHAHCVNVLEARKLVQDAYCSSIDEAQVCHCHTGMVKEFGHRNQDCDKYPAIGAKDQKCCDAFYEHEMQFSECTKAHMDAEFAKKQHAIIMTKMCKTYSMCYDRHLKEYQATEKHVKENQQHRSWDVVYRIQCLLESFKSGKVSKSDADACKAKLQDPKGISYPSVPVKEPCFIDVGHA